MTITVDRNVEDKSCKRGDMNYELEDGMHKYAFFPIPRTSDSGLIVPDFGSPTALSSLCPLF